MRLAVMRTLGIKRIAKTPGAGGRRGPRALDWWTHPSLDYPSEPRPLAGDPGDAAKDGAPTFEGGSRFQKLCVGHPPLWCIVLMDGCASEICIKTQYGEAHIVR